MRTDMIAAELANGFFATAPNVMQSVLDAVNNGAPKLVANDIEVSNNNVVYQEISNVAVISITGGMYKRDMSAMCMNVISYPAILQANKKAEENPRIDTTLFRVDTPGGHVDGADEVEQAIYSSKNKTVAMFENTGASGGLWIFPAADEVYATEATMLGSVGVVATYRNPEEDSSHIEQTSKRAPNKRCKLGEDCKRNMQTMLDGYEDMFYARLEKNTGFSAEKIEKTFNSGGMIFAKEAQKAGFVKEITTFDALLSSLIDGGVNRKASAQINSNPTGGNSMSKEQEYTQESFAALEKENAEALATMQLKLDASETDLEEALNMSTESTKDLKALQAKVDARVDAMPEIIAMALDRGVDKDTLVKMAQVETLADAKVVVVDGSSSDGAFGASTRGMKVSSPDTVTWNRKKGQ